MGYYKINKKYKILILFLFLFFAFNIISFGAENTISPVVIKGLFVDSQLKVSSSANGILTYYQLYDGVTYKINNNGPDVQTYHYFEKFPELGAVSSSYFYIKSGESREFIPSGDGFLAIVISSQSGIDRTGFTTVTYEDTGFLNSIILLVDSVGFSSLWSTFENSIPYILVVVLVSFSLLIIFSSLRGLSKGKGRM